MYNHGDNSSAPGNSGKLTQKKEGDVATLADPLDVIPDDYQVKKGDVATLAYLLDVKPDNYQVKKGNVATLADPLNVIPDGVEERSEGL